jgi:hypothetical protein
MTTMTRQTDDLVRPALDHRTAMRLAGEEYRRMADALAALSDDDWAKPTDCPAWDVRKMGCHMVGMAAMVTSPLEQRRQQRAAASDSAVRGIDPLDAPDSRSRSAPPGHPPTSSPAPARSARARSAGAA